MSKIKNTQIGEELEVQSVTGLIEQRRLSWWRHLNRTASIRPRKQVWNSEMCKKSEEIKIMKNLR